MRNLESVIADGVIEVLLALMGILMGVAVSLSACPGKELPCESKAPGEAQVCK